MKWFQLTAARRRLVLRHIPNLRILMFQLTAARRRLEIPIPIQMISLMFQLTAARRRLVGLPMSLSIMFDVSTHSRPKAAGILLIVVIAILKAFQLTAARRRLGDYNANGIRTWSFNSQPPEGGWSINTVSRWPP